MPHVPEPFVVGQGTIPRPEELTAPPVVREEAEPAPTLPDEMVGESPPEHTWLGKGLVWTMYAVAASLIVWALRLIATDETSSVSAKIVLLPMFLFIAAVYIWAAWSIGKFRLVGLGVGLLVLAGMLLSGGRLLLDADTLLGGVLSGGLLVLSVAWIGYLCARFGDFR